MRAADEIAKLAVLRDQGAIYEQEFAHAKAKLLGTPSPTGPLHVVDIIRKERAGQLESGQAACGRMAGERLSEPRKYPARRDTTPNG